MFFQTFIYSMHETAMTASSICGVGADWAYKRSFMYITD